MAPAAVEYDGATFLVRGERVLLLAGSVHYPRVQPQRWAAVFAGMRAAGLNTIETYVFWGEHAVDAEAVGAEASYDFTGRRDLFGFLAAAAAAGLHAILRIGPYVCAEVSYGGFPSALRDVPGIRFRTVNAPFQAAVAAWLRHLGAELHARKLLAPAGGPVLLVQLENEYQMVAGAYGDAGARYLQWCADLQHELAFGVPTIMCYGAADGAVETVNAFYAHEEVPALRRARPRQPAVWTECWTGWYDVWGAPHHRRPVPDLAYAVARFFAVGGAGHCYYMWMGGSNYGRAPMYLQATSYDYDAPVDEFGMETTKSRHLAALHRVILQRYQPLLFARGDAAELCNADGGVDMPPARQLAPDVVCFEWAPTLVFVCNDSVTAASPDGLDVVAMRLAPLAPRSVRIVDTVAGVVLYDSAVVAPECIVTRVRSPATIVKPSGRWVWRSRREPLPLPGSVKPQPRASAVADLPVEQLLLTKDQSDYCWYSAEFEWTSEEAARAAVARGAVFEMHACDYVYVYVNGVYCGRSDEPLWEDRKNNKWNATPDPPGFLHRISADFSGTVEAEVGAPFTITLLVCSLGLVKGDWQLGDGPSANMLEEKKGLLSDVAITARRAARDGAGGGGGNVGGERDAAKVAGRVSPWTAVAGLEGEAAGWADGLAEEAGEGEGREAAAVKEKGRRLVHPVWLETTISPDTLCCSWVLDLGSMGKGLLWVNGVLLGRYWDVAGTRPRNGFLAGSPIVQDERGPATQRYYHVPPWVVPETSDGPPELRITLFEERGGDASPAGIALHYVE
jgi:beta-galactosidase